MGNDMSCKTVSIGKVRVKNHEGKVVILTKVRYVHEMQKIWSHLVSRMGALLIVKREFLQ